MPAGLPYVGWGARPDKNGQPPACIGQCNLNIGARKVGAAMKVYPNLRYGPKSKEQILQKWDPTTKSIVNIHVHECPPDSVKIIGFSIQSSVSCAITIAVFNIMTNHTIFAKVYDSGGTLVNTPQNVGYNSGLVRVPANLLEGSYYYATLSNNLGDVLSKSALAIVPYDIWTINGFNFIYSTNPSTSLQRFQLSFTDTTNVNGNPAYYRVYNETSSNSLVTSAPQSVSASSSESSVEPTTSMVTGNTYYATLTNSLGFVLARSPSITYPGDICTITDFSIQYDNSFYFQQRFLLTFNPTNIVLGHTITYTIFDSFNNIWIAPTQIVNTTISTTINPLIDTPHPSGTYTALLRNSVGTEIYRSQPLSYPGDILNITGVSVSQNATYPSRHAVQVSISIINVSSYGEFFYVRLFDNSGAQITIYTTESLTTAYSLNRYRITSGSPLTVTLYCILVPGAIYSSRLSYDSPTPPLTLSTFNNITFPVDNVTINSVTVSQSSTTPTFNVSVNFTRVNVGTYSTITLQFLNASNTVVATQTITSATSPATFTDISLAIGGLYSVKVLSDYTSPSTTLSSVGNISYPTETYTINSITVLQYGPATGPTPSTPATFNVSVNFTRVNVGSYSTSTLQLLNPSNQVVGTQNITSVTSPATFTNISLTVGTTYTARVLSNYPTASTIIAGPTTFLVDNTISAFTEDSSNVSFSGATPSQPTFTFADISTSTDRMTSISSYSTASSNFTMDYVAGPSANNTTFGWRLTNKDDATLFIYGYVFVNTNNQWNLSIGDSSNGLARGPTTVYTGLSPTPKFRVILTTANNISVSLFNADGSISEISSFSYGSIGLGNFRASFGRHYDPVNPTATLGQEWTVSYTNIP
jgi:hypothetical protein